MFDALARLPSAPQAPDLPRTAPGQAPGADRVDLVVAGAPGQVGTALRGQLARRHAWLREHEGLDLRVIAGFGRRCLAIDLDGLPAGALAGQARSAGDGERLLEALCRPRRAACVLVDCTASEEIADWYPRLLAAGVGVVAANKRANARGFSHYRHLQALARRGGAPYRYETTVGAAIPVLGPIRDLRLRGERIESLRGVLSGSLSHVLHRLHEGLAFSAAVAEARALGLTEPDPFEDLAAHDLSRKLLVLAREAGFAIEPEDLRIEPLCAAPAAGESQDAALAAADSEWHARVQGALGRGERLVVLAEADATGGRIGVGSLPADAPFARLAPGENRVEVRTEWQSRAPLALAGPGAGAEITAAGLVSDILQAARELAPRRRSLRQ